MTPLLYADLTSVEKAWMCNGCGPKLGISVDLVPEFIFHEACQRHDFDYWSGFRASDRKLADQRFLRHMLDAAARETSWWSQRWHTFLAYRYFAGVRAFGTKAFSFRASYATREDLVREMAADPL